MNKLIAFVLGSVAAIAVAVGALATTTNATSTTSATTCEAKSIGKSNLQTTKGSAYTIENGVATVHFNVTGPKDCTLQVTMVSWKAPSLSGAPFKDQKIMLIKRQIFTPGNNQTMSIQTPNCYFQIDALKGESPYGSDYSKGYGSRQIASIHGGNKKCVDTPPEKVQVCNPATGEVIEVEKGKESIYKPVGDVACQDTPETPETPEELPQTGVVSNVLGLFGIGSLVATTSAWIRSRRIGA